MTATGTSWEMRTGQVEDLPKGAIGVRGKSWLCPYLALDEARQGKVGTITLDGADIRDEIFLAADNRPGHKPSIRRELLEACNLRELPE